MQQSKHPSDGSKYPDKAATEKAIHRYKRGKRPPRAVLRNSASAHADWPRDAGSSRALHDRHRGSSGLSRHPHFLGWVPVIGRATVYHTDTARRAVHRTELHGHRRRGARRRRTRRTWSRSCPAARSAHVRVVHVVARQRAPRTAAARRVRAIAARLAGCQQCYLSARTLGCVTASARTSADVARHNLRAVIGRARLPSRRGGRAPPTRHLTILRLERPYRRRIFLGQAFGRRRGRR